MPRPPRAWFRRRPTAAGPPPGEPAAPTAPVPSTGLPPGCFEELARLRERREDDAYERCLVDGIAALEAEAEADERHAIALFELYWRLARHYRRQGRLEDQYALLVWWSSAQSRLPIPLTSHMAGRLKELRPC